MSGFASGAASHRARNAGQRGYGEYGEAAGQAEISGHDDLLDEEVGALTEAVVKLKGMATAIGEESIETGKVQDAVAKQLEAAQEALGAGVRKMKRMHREMTGSCGNMLVLSLYAVALVLGVVFLARLKALISWVF